MTTNNKKFKVTVNVYDLSRGFVKPLSKQILGTEIEGIWHTGIVVYDREYFFGGGIQHLPKGQFATSQNIEIYKEIDMGYTDIQQDMFHEYLATLYKKHNQDTYNIIKNNCNHFSNDILEFLTGKNMPPYILDQVNSLCTTPLGSVIINLLSNINGTDPFKK